METNLNEWPPIDGRYEVGNKTSPVAVCTNASIDEIKIDPQKIAIIGKCVTENIGIEKMIQNIVSNPNIRYLVLCGRESNGHFVGQAIESLIENGVDENKRIISAKGNMPYLRNLDKETIETFREQVIPVNLMEETNGKKIEKVIDELLKIRPQKMKAKGIKIEKVEEIKASPSYWIEDPKGYFVISLDNNRKKIVVEYYKKGKLNKKIIGNNAKEICDTIARLDLIGDFKQTKEHSMYLGRELQKAEIALKQGLTFEQDQELKINKVDNLTQPEPIDEYGWYD